MEFGTLLSWIEQSGSCLLQKDISKSTFLFHQSKDQTSIFRSANELENFEEANANHSLAGFLAYDFRHELEDLIRAEADVLDFPTMHFFIPQSTVELTLPQGQKASLPIEVKPVFTRDRYLESAERLLKHIHRGDIYEVNFCMPFYCSFEELCPLSLFAELHKASPMPHAALYKTGEHFILSMSPERFLRRSGNRLYSEPMKGTARRTEDLDDNLVREKLIRDEKERSENIMITDLVRNDLSRIASRGSVRVSELCEVYPFPGLFQMISKVECELKEKMSFLDILQATFPMGSMTGAPKISAMDLITSAEGISRGPYSGALGFFQKGGDFDLNVLIRSIFINKKKKLLSFWVGSALTANCDPENEYNECLLKARSILKILTGKETLYD